MPETCRGLNEEFDVVFHLGVYSSSPMYRKDPQLVAKALSQWISILEYVQEQPVLQARLRIVQLACTTGTSPPSPRT